MTFDEFQSRVVPVKGQPEMSEKMRMLYESNAMCGEAGEVANVVKKVVRDGVSGDEDIIDECGDVLFYMKQLLGIRGYTIQDAAESLLAKLQRQRAEAAS